MGFAESFLKHWRGFPGKKAFNRLASTSVCDVGGNVGVGEISQPILPKSERLLDLRPRQARLAPSTQGATLMFLIQIAFKTLQHIEHAREPGGFQCLPRVN